MSGGECARVMVCESEVLSAESRAVSVECE